jgi:hypothetical protein
MATSKKEKKTEEQFPGASPVVDFNPVDPSQDFGMNLDQDLINELESKIKEKKDELKSKVYAVSCDPATFDLYEKYMSEEAEWASTEALGILEINRKIKSIKAEGIKDNVIYLGALPLEASHYFITKAKGAGSKSAEDFIKLFKPFDQALRDTKEDAMQIKDLEKQLTAAQQGLSLG